jgi:hypothetical protein
VTGEADDGRFVDPVAVFARTVALTGCAWWNGTLYVGAYNDGEVRSIDPHTGAIGDVWSFPAGVTDVQVGPDGRLYVATSSAIWRIDASTPPSPTPFANPSAPGRARTWIAIGAAIVLAAALAWRLRAGRALRPDASPPDA